MNRNYLIYPTKTMRITQTYTGTTSHLPHTTGTPKDYPFDEGCSNSGRDYLYCPCDSMSIKRIYGVENPGTNTLWLESDSKVLFADGSEDYFTMLVTHPDDSDLKKLKVGQKFERKEKICREGKDGATAFHFHISAGKGLYKNKGWTKNSKGKWVLEVTKSPERPEDLFFVDESFTKILDSKDLDFVTLKNAKNRFTPGNYKVTANLVNVRTGPSTKYKKKSFFQLSASAQRKILRLTDGKPANGYVKGLGFTVYEVRSNWGRTPSGWVCLDYCEALK